MRQQIYKEEMRYDYQNKDNVAENYPVIENQYFFILDKKNKIKNHRKIRTIIPNVKNHHSFSGDPQYTNNNLLFHLKESLRENNGPAVGDYQISTPIVKPAFQTYEKNEDIILVKINYIGGTSSFRNEEQRFAEGYSSSIYPLTSSPGPGSYQTIQPTARRYKELTRHNENYGLIQQILRNTHETTVSIPNYEIQNKVNGMQYNGIPKHLQVMYDKISNKALISKEKSMPLEKLINLRKRMENLPMRSVRNTHRSIESNQTEYLPAENNKVLKQMTQTLYKLNENQKKQELKQRKLDELLQGKARKRSISLSYNKEKAMARQKVGKNELFNKNMINILFDKLKKN